MPEIPAPTPDDLKRNAALDLAGAERSRHAGYIWPDLLAAWIRRAVAAEAENARYEEWLSEADAAASDHFKAAGNPMPRGSNWLEALWDLPRELAALRDRIAELEAENVRLREGKP